MKFFFQYLENPDKNKPISTYWTEPSVNDVQGAFAESLLLGETITIKLAYESVSKLVEWLGVGLFEELLAEDVLQFCALEPIGTAYITNEFIRTRRANILPGLSLIVGTDPGDTTIDGRISLELRRNTKLSRKERRRLTSSIQKKTVQVNNEIIKTAHSAARSDIGGLIGKELGFPIGENPDSGDLNKIQVGQYLKVASGNLNIHLAAEFGCDNLIANRMTSRILEQRMVNALNKIKMSAADYRTLLKLEQVPDMGCLLKEGKVSYEKIFELSRSSEAKSFREWINSIEPSDELDIIRQYQLELVRRLNDTPLVKTFKVLAYTGLGAVSSLIDPSGVASGLAINSFDAFILDALKKKWRPKIFLNQLKEINSI